MVSGESWARRHARENPGHLSREGLDDPGSCADCRERSPIYDLPHLVVRRARWYRAWLARVEDDA
ncbi:hypothetical protein [Nocardioides mesophilus]|uniref:Uncharacterized protein n=1 Tax=Nocardioides mesophilus TaxID=433659 RepID=A0A7G9RA74_9ACTN|nr:hypothetical protein [Nocardioides mesophilus]QNN52499.1 hypothetical protein H9L09_18825 [Nocardioides mesophilus]